MIWAPGSIGYSQVLGFRPCPSRSGRRNRLTDSDLASLSGDRSRRRPIEECGLAPVHHLDEWARSGAASHQPLATPSSSRSRRPAESSSTKSAKEGDLGGGGIAFFDCWGGSLLRTGCRMAFRQRSEPLRAAVSSFPILRHIPPGPGRPPGGPAPAAPTCRRRSVDPGTQVPLRSESAVLDFIAWKHGCPTLEVFAHVDHHLRGEVLGGRRRPRSPGRSRSVCPTFRVAKAVGVSGAMRSTPDPTGQLLDNLRWVKPYPVNPFGDRFDLRPVARPGDHVQRPTVALHRGQPWPARVASVPEVGAATSAWSAAVSSS